jgi:hypothetical protein
VTNPAVQAEATNSAATLATGNMNKPSNTEEETKTAKDNQVGKTEIETAELAVSENLFFDIAALDPQHVNKKAKHDFGFGALHWGNRLGGMPNAKFVNAQYIHFFK